MKWGMLLHVLSTTIVASVISSWVMKGQPDGIRELMGYSVFAAAMWVMWSAMEYPRR